MYSLVLYFFTGIYNAHTIGYTTYSRRTMMSLSVLLALLERYSYNLLFDVINGGIVELVKNLNLRSQ